MSLARVFKKSQNVLLVTIHLIHWLNTHLSWNWPAWSFPSSTLAFWKSSKRPSKNCMGIDPIRIPRLHLMPKLLPPRRRPDRLFKVQNILSSFVHIEQPIHSPSPLMPRDNRMWLQRLNSVQRAKPLLSFFGWTGFPKELMHISIHGVSRHN